MQIKGKKLFSDLISTLWNRTPKLGFASSDDFIRKPICWCHAELEGYKADLVLLNKNPLESIRNMKAVETVIIEDKVFDRELIDEMLEAVKTANNNSRTKDITPFLAPNYSGRAHHLGCNHGF